MDTHVQCSLQQRDLLRDTLSKNELDRLLPALPALSAGGHLCQSSAIPAYSPYTTTCKAISVSVVPTVMSQTDVKDAKAAGCLGKLLVAGAFWRVFRNMPTSLTV